MDCKVPNPVLIFALRLYLPMAMLALGLLAGWMLGRGTRRQALGSLLLGGVIVYGVQKALDALLLYSICGTWTLTIP